LHIMCVARVPPASPLNRRLICWKPPRESQPLAGQRLFHRLKRSTSRAAGLTCEFPTARLRCLHNIVCDPVIASTSGTILLNRDGVSEGPRFAEGDCYRPRFRRSRFASIHPSAERRGTRLNGFIAVYKALTGYSPI